MKTTRLKLKTNILFLGLAAMCVVASCKKDKENGNIVGEGFEATTEHGGDGSKTYLDSVTVKWTDDDAIRVSNRFGTSLKYSLVEGKNTSVGKFYTGENHDDFFHPDYVAIYPSCDVNYVDNTINGTMATFNLLNTQPYVDAGFGNKFNPMVAYSSNRRLPFKNVLGGICLSLKGSCHITSIVLTSDTQTDKLWGTGVVECKPGNTGYLALNITNNAADKHVITLTCDVTLSETDSINACFMVPPGTLQNGFTLSLYNGETLVCEKPIIKDFGAGFIQRSHITRLTSSIVVEEPQDATVTVLVDENGGGTASGGGTYSIGQSCTVSAAPNSGYNFIGWTINDEMVSTEEDYSFTVTQDVTLVAHFTNFIMTVTTNSPTWITTSTAKGGGSVSTTGTGTVVERGICWAMESETNMPTIDNNHLAIGSGTGNFASGQTGMSGMQKDVVYYVRGYAKDANGVYAYGPSIPFATRKDYPNDYQGRIPFAYSVSPSSTVNFSMGNLFYMGASGGTWKFADYQFEYLTNNSEQTQLVQQSNGIYAGNPNVNRDKFCFATSGYNHNNNNGNYHQPWSFGWWDNKFFTNAFYAYHPTTWTYYLRNGSSHNADWGYNSITNGGNTLDYWHTLNGCSGGDEQSGEWQYLLNYRTQTQYRYAITQLDVRDGSKINGLLIFPDGFSFPTQYYPIEYNNVASHSNGSTASYTTNSLNEAQWSILEKYGTVFLPSAGARIANGGIYSVDGSFYQVYMSGNQTMFGTGTLGYYWSASPVNDNSNNRQYQCWILGIEPADVNTGTGTVTIYPSGMGVRAFGVAVRLVH